MVLSKRGLVLAAGGLAAVCAATGASAQYHERDRNVGVGERPNPGYDPIGIPLGGFRGYATLPVGVEYNNNVFASPTEEEDFIFLVRPRAEVRSQWSQHMLVGTLEVDQATYQDFDTEDRTNVRLGGQGRLDIQRGFYATLDLTNGWLEEARTDASSPLAALEPVEYDNFYIRGGASKEFNRLMLSGAVSQNVLDYDNALFADGVTVLLQNDRDHDQTVFMGRADYGITPTTAFFASVSASERRYELNPTNTPGLLFARDSDGLTYFVGANFDITNLIRGEVSVGYLEEDYADALVQDVDGLAAHVAIEWFPTPLATFEFSADRAVSDSGIIGAAGALTTTLAARVDYELRRNVIVTGQLSHRDDELQGLAREDEGLAAAIDVLYLLNQNVGASVTLQHAERESSGVAQGGGFDQESVALNLVLRY